MRPSILFFLSWLSFALLGCNTTAPTEEIYQPPAGPGMAWITGSTIQESKLFSPRHVGYVMLVDGKFVRDAEENWSQPIALSPGQRTLGVEYRSSVFRSRAVFTLDAAAGARYVLKITPGLNPEDDRHFCEFVIIDTATGQPVTAAKHTYATGSPSNKSNFRPLD